MALQQSEGTIMIESGEKPDIDALVGEAIPFMKSFFGVTVDYPHPVVLLDQGDSVVREGRACYNTELNAICSPSIVSMGYAIPMAGEESVHWAHFHENRSLHERIKEIVEEGRRVSRDERPRIVNALNEIRNLEEFVGALGRLSFSDSKGMLRRVKQRIASNTIYRENLYMKYRKTFNEIESLFYLKTILAAVNYEIIRDLDPSERRRILHVSDSKGLLSLLREWENRRA